MHPVSHFSFPSLGWGLPRAPVVVTRTPGVLVALAAATVLAGACGSAPVSVPSALQAAGHKPAFTLFARGVQIYECTAASGAAPAWVFVAPEAELFDSASSSAVIGTHGAGPFWRAGDGSRTVGKVKARVDAPAAGAIPWLLLETTSDAAPGRLARVTHVQRVNTVGGVAPAGACGEVGRRARVPYTSDYVFLVSA